MDTEQDVAMNVRDAGQTAYTGQDAGQTAYTGEQGDDSLMTKDLAADDRRAGNGRGFGKDAGNGRGAKDGLADTAPETPEGYALAFAGEIQVDRELLAGFQKTAHELGLAPSQAQKLADMYVAHQGKAEERMALARQRAVEAARAQWESEIERSPTFAQDRENIRAALRLYGDKELYDLLNQTNLGSHPKMWDFMAKIGKGLAEPGFHGKSGSRKEAPLAARLWPNM